MRVEKILGLLGLGVVALSGNASAAGGTTSANVAVTANPNVATATIAHEFFEEKPHIVTNCPVLPKAAYKVIALEALPKPYTAAGYPNIVVVEDPGDMVGGGDINLAAAAKYFYRGFADDRDFLFVFATTKDPVSANYNAYYRSVRNNVKGIGLSDYDYTSSYGSNSKLLGVANMNTVNKWKNYLFPVLDLWPLGVITHEIGHQWIAYVKVNNGTITTDPNANDRSHWAPLTQTEASIMYGNEWKQVTPEVTLFGKKIPATFVSTSIPGGFSSLDKYLMGVHGTNKVKNFFRIEATKSNILARYAIPGNTAAGTKVNYSVNDITSKNGARVPAYTSAQTTFKAGFVIVVSKGKKPTSDELKVVEYFRKRIPEHFKDATDGRFTITTSVVKK